MFGNMFASLLLALIFIGASFPFVKLNGWWILGDVMLSFIVASIWLGVVVDNLIHSDGSVASNFWKLKYVVYLIVGTIVITFVSIFIAMLIVSGAW